MAEETIPVRWNPRYLCYATAHSRTPEEQRAHDREAWPGGCAAGFILWNGERLREFERENPSAFFKRWGGPTNALVDHDAYDAWLARWAEKSKETRST